MDRVEIGAHNLKFNGLKRWDETDVPLYDVMVDDPLSKKISPFKYDSNLNKKIILWFVH